MKLNFEIIFPLKKNEKEFIFIKKLFYLNKLSDFQKFNSICYIKILENEKIALGILKDLYFLSYEKKFENNKLGNLYEKIKIMMTNKNLENKIGVFCSLNGKIPFYKTDYFLKINQDFEFIAKVSFFNKNGLNYSFCCKVFLLD